MTDLRQLERDLELLGEDIGYLNILTEPLLVAGSDAVGTAPIATRPRSGAAHVWHSLTRREAADAWKALTSFVDWLVDRYHLEDTLPGCWYRHGALVDELDALRATWIAAYLNPNGLPTDAAAWLELLARALTRIRDWDRYGCAAGTHHDDTALPIDVEAREARDAFLFADSQARGGPGQREPTEAPT
jgi:hypothetical protein